MAATERPPLRGASVETRVLAVENGVGRERRDRVAGEEPLEIRAAGPRQEPVRVAVTMRTPGNDFELAAGFLHSEGLLRSPLELSEIKYCTDIELGEQAYNVVTVHLRRPFEADLVQRNFGVTSAKVALHEIGLERPPEMHRDDVVRLLTQLDVGAVLDLGELEWRAQEPFGVQEAGRELEIVPGRAHRDRHAHRLLPRACRTDLERLLPGHAIAALAPHTVLHCEHAGLDGGAAQRWA